MNLRHAAALALVGWYLMTPPVNGNWDTDVSVKIEAPRSEWDIFGRCAMSGCFSRQYQVYPKPKMVSGSIGKSQEGYRVRCTSRGLHRDRRPRDSKTIKLPITVDLIPAVALNSRATSNVEHEPSAGVEKRLPLCAD
jgi:hypothetical protein